MHHLHNPFKQCNPPKVMPQKPCSTDSSTTHTMLPLHGSWNTGNMNTRMREICTSITSICVARCASITSLDCTPARRKDEMRCGGKVSQACPYIDGKGKLAGVDVEVRPEHVHLVLHVHNHVRQELLQRVKQRETQRGRNLGV
ncbi:hypothetical protein E2C01_022965 [Portunus trituberculatus]|uniref:Uncharacterized protein n=1 Tax=Portunus trituberculatus TaxID=210409 RepID=A0A5B7E8H9_PORTR|nr:hypothetical protein [Portunus trituberculatus]